MGGGGDIVGALATAEFARLYDGADPVLGGLSWERRPIDPEPGPRTAAEIEGATELAPGILIAGPETRVRASGVLFAESHMARVLGQETVLIDVSAGPATISSGLSEAIDHLGCDLAVFVDVGGDVLANGDEPGLRSPLADAIMLAVAARLHRAGQPVLIGIFGTACDAELTPQEVLEHVSRVAAAGGFAGARGLTDPVAERLEEAMRSVPTEASAQAVRAFRGGFGAASIRGGTRTLELSAIAAVTMYLDVEAAISAAGRLAAAVDPAGDLEQANDALHAIGVATELDLERDAAAAAPN
jgi:hypothetical protein